MIDAHDITLAQATDATAIAELSRDAIEYGLPWRWTTRRVLHCIRDASTHAIVMRSAGTLQGFAIMKYGDEEAHVLLLAVRTPGRRAGRGSALLGWLEHSARVAGIARLRLEARAGNAAASAFYRRHGFVEAGRQHLYYEAAEDAVRWVKALRPAA